MKTAIAALFLSSVLVAANPARAADYLYFSPRGTYHTHTWSNRSNYGGVMFAPRGRTHLWQGDYSGGAYFGPRSFGVWSNSPSYYGGQSFYGNQPFYGW